MRSPPWRSTCWCNRPWCWDGDGGGGRPYRVLGDPLHVRRRPAADHRAGRQGGRLRCCRGRGRVASAVAAFYAGQAILAGKGLQARIGDPQALRSVLGAGLYLAVLGLLALRLGTLIRRTAGAIAAVAGLIIILPVLVQGLPSSWQDAITRYLPSVAGQAIIGRTKFAPPGPLLSPWPGFALFCAYAAAVLTAAGIVLNGRDT